MVEFVSWQFECGTFLSINNLLQSIDILNMSKVRSTIIQFDASKYANKCMNVETVHKMKEVFDLFDYDHSGQISMEEIINTIKALNMESQAANIINIVQTNTDAEELDFATFLGIFGQQEEAN